MAPGDERGTPKSGDAVKRDQWVKVTRDRRVSQQRSVGQGQQRSGADTENVGPVC